MANDKKSIPKELAESGHKNPATKTNKQNTRTIIRITEQTISGFGQRTNFFWAYRRHDIKDDEIMPKSNEKIIFIFFCCFKKKKKHQRASTKKNRFFQRLPLWSKLSPERWSYLSESTVSIN
jgi:hypothetical protein